MKIRKNSMIIIFLMVTWLLILIFTPHFNFSETFTIKLLSMFGVIELMIIYYTEYLKTGKWFTLYTIFISFYFFFNYGQCLMWAFGFHTDHEIGKWWVYIFNPASASVIIKTQLFVLKSGYFFHCGAMVCHLFKRKYDNIITKNDLLFKANLILSFITVPCMFYSVIHNLIVSMSHGYSSLYYGEYAYSGNSLLIILGGMGFACLIGLLFNSNFDKKVIKWVYIIFGLYVLFDLASGDRGGFLYKLILLFYLYNTYYKKISLKKLIIYSVIGLMSLYFIYAVKDIRNDGISLSSIINALDFQNNPIIKAMFEMGFSMNIVIVLLSRNPVYPFGNTYINGIIGMPTAHTVEIFKPGYIGVSEWFSQKYLNISYGAGFSIIGESYINFGYYGSFLMQFLIGIMVYALLNPIIKGISSNNRGVMSVIAASLLIPLCRNTFQIFAKNFFYGVIIYYIFILIIYNFLKKKGVNYETKN